GVVDELDRAAPALAARLVVGDEGDLQRRAGAFHLAGRAAEQADAAGFEKAVDGRGGRGGGFGAGIDRGDAVLADQRGVHALDGRIVERQAGGDDQEVVGDL